MNRDKDNDYPASSSPYIWRSPDRGSIVSARDIVEEEGREKNKARRVCLALFIFLSSSLYYLNKRDDSMSFRQNRVDRCLRHTVSNAEQRYHCFALTCLLSYENTLRTPSASSSRSRPSLRRCVSSSASFRLLYLPPFSRFSAIRAAAGDTNSVNPA